jgi:hypothetical protein
MSRYANHSSGRKRAQRVPQSWPCGAVASYQRPSCGGAFRSSAQLRSFWRPFLTVPNLPAVVRVCRCGVVGRTHPKTGAACHFRPAPRCREDLGKPPAATSTQRLTVAASSVNNPVFHGLGPFLTTRRRQCQHTDVLPDNACTPYVDRLALHRHRCIAASSGDPPPRRQCNGVRKSPHPYRDRRRIGRSRRAPLGQNPHILCSAALAHRHEPHEALGDPRRSKSCLGPLLLICGDERKAAASWLPVRVDAIDVDAYPPRASLTENAVSLVYDDRQQGWLRHARVVVLQDGSGWQHGLGPIPAEKDCGTAAHPQRPI